jgi:hypothetical protein
LDTHIANVKLQNKIYFENKARELLERRKEDSLSLAAANLLFKNLNLKMENFLTSPLPTKDTGSAKSKSNQSGKSSVLSSKEGSKQHPFKVENTQKIVLHQSSEPRMQANSMRSNSNARRNGQTLNISKGTKGAHKKSQRNYSASQGFRESIT